MFPLSLIIQIRCQFEALKAIITEFILTSRDVPYYAAESRLISMKDVYNINFVKWAQLLQILCRSVAIDPLRKLGFLFLVSSTKPRQLFGKFCYTEQLSDNFWFGGQPDGIF